MFKPKLRLYESAMATLEQWKRDLNIFFEKLDLTGTGSGGYSGIYVSNTAPDSPDNDDLWLKPNDYSEYIDYTKTANATLTASETGIILCSNAITITLPVVSGNRGLTYTIVNVGTRSITIDGNGDETINGSANTTLSAKWQKVKLYCTGTQWVII